MEANTADLRQAPLLSRVIGHAQEVIREMSNLFLLASSMVLEPLH